MPKLKSRQLNTLLMQGKYAPHKQRLIQMEACETLMRLVEPGRSYPFEFVCYHVTGYRPRGKSEPELIDYRTLVHDLPIYVEGLSRTMTLPAAMFGQKVLTVESLARRYSVCSKTVRRWRSEGLIGRFLLFADGRRRMGFLASSVEFFARRERERLRKGRQFSRLSAAEREKIIRRLKKWAIRCPGERQEALCRTARKFGRSLETVRSLLVKLEEQGTQWFGATAVGAPEGGFAKRPVGMEPEERKEIYRLYRAGAEMAELMKRFGRSKTNVYRAINLERVETLLAVPIEYMPSDEFARVIHPEEMLRAPADLFRDGDVSGSFREGEGTEENGPQTEISSKALGSLEAYVQDIVQGQVLSGKQEAFLFRKYNYLKYQAAQWQKQLDREFPQSRKLKAIEGYLGEAQEVKELLIRSNLRLVLSVARKHTRNEAEMLELVSEGNEILMRAVEKFDYRRGFKFSTYATWAIAKRYATLRTPRKHMVPVVANEEMLEVADNPRVVDNRVLALESARKSLDEVMAETLEERESRVVREHYGLTEKTKVPGQRKAKSLKEIGAVMGLSKERIRQIELLALQKLRKVLTAEQFEVLTQG